jgi:hypothetical protein
MAAERSSMRKIRELLRLQAAGHSRRDIARSLAIAHSTVGIRVINAISHWRGIRRSTEDSTLSPSARNRVYSVRQIVRRQGSNIRPSVEGLILDGVGALDRYPKPPLKLVATRPKPDYSGSPNRGSNLAEVGMFCRFPPPCSPKSNLAILPVVL